jgi:hypothetical protein
MRTARLARLALIAVTIAACDPGFLYAIRNSSEQPILVRLDDFIGYHSDSYVAPPGTLSTIELGLGPSDGVTLVAMDPDTCQVIRRLRGNGPDVTFVYSADGQLAIDPSASEPDSQLLADGRCGGIPPSNYAWIVNNSDQTLVVTTTYTSSQTSVTVPPHEQGYAYHRNDRDSVATVRVMGSTCKPLDAFQNDGYQTLITVGTSGQVTLDPNATDFYLDQPSNTFASSPGCTPPAATQSPV